MYTIYPILLETGLFIAFRNLPQKQVTSLNLPEFLKHASYQAANHCQQKTD